MRSRKCPFLEIVFQYCHSSLVSICIFDEAVLKKESKLATVFRNRNQNRFQIKSLSRTEIKLRSKLKLR